MTLRRAAALAAGKYTEGGSDDEDFQVADESDGEPSDDSGEVRYYV